MVVYLAGVYQHASGSPGFYPRANGGYGRHDNVAAITNTLLASITGNQVAATIGLHHHFQNLWCSARVAVSSSY